MATVKDSFLDLERRRRQLEENVAKLRGLLQHWQTWEAEYEGFKEEIQNYNDIVPTQNLVGNVMNEKQSLAYALLLSSPSQ